MSIRDLKRVLSATSSRNGLARENNGTRNDWLQNEVIREKLLHKETTVERWKREE